MFEKLKYEQRKKFIGIAFISFPIAFSIPLIGLVGFLILTGTTISSSTFSFVVGGVLLIGICIIANIYRKLLKESEGELKEQDDLPILIKISLFLIGISILSWVIRLSIAVFKQ